MVPPTQTRCYLGDRQQEWSVGRVDIALTGKTAGQTQKSVRLFPRSQKTKPLEHPEFPGRLLSL